MIENRKESGSIDSHKPVCSCPAKRRFIQSIILCSRPKFFKSLADCRILHAADPKPFHRLFTTCQLINTPENQFSFPPRVTGIHNLRHIRRVQQRFQHLELLFLILSHRHFPMFRDNRKVLTIPFLIPGVITRRIGKTGQMTHAPADSKAISLQVSILSLLCPNNSRQTLGHRGLLCNHKYTHLHHLRFFRCIGFRIPNIEPI